MFQRRTGTKCTYTYCANLIPSRTEIYGHERCANCSKSDSTDQTLSFSVWNWKYFISSKCQRWMLFLAHYYTKYEWNNWQWNVAYFFSSKNKIYLTTPIWSTCMGVKAKHLNNITSWIDSVLNRNYVLHPTVVCLPRIYLSTICVIKLKPL